MGKVVFEGSMKGKTAGRVVVAEFAFGGIGADGGPGVDAPGELLPTIRTGR
jgi:hypothetical protein